MWCHYVVAIFFLAYLVNVLVHGNSDHPLHQRLNSWHTLKEEDIYVHRHKRSLSNDDVVVPLDKQVSFVAFNRSFTLSLMPSFEILSPEFKAFSQNNKDIKELQVDKTSIYTGTVMDDPKSHVSAYFNGRTLTANIETHNDTVIVEPMWRHLPPETTKSEDTEQTSRTDMLVYRQSDVNLLNYQDPHSRNGFCQTEDLMNSLRREQHKQGREKKVEEEKRFSNRNRAKRSSGKVKKICKLSLVADFRFYKEMGNSNKAETLYYLISLIERVNTIYKRTDWGPAHESGKYVGYGFQINRIIIHTEPTPLNATENTYNQDRYWEARDLLEAFSARNYSQCLSHLFTYIDFKKGLLGLAYVGSPKDGDVGGICTKPYVNRFGNTMHLNTGLTSTVNWGKRILTTEADLVTAHELGHNFGADHDDNTEQEFTRKTVCTPGQANGGNYIMFPAAVSGQYDNNDEFSECSKHAIYPTLMYKADKCFEEESHSFCGNFQIDEGETCDVGIFDNENDKCCFSHNCTLKPHAKCSYRNSPCCTPDCQIADTTKLCRVLIPGLCHNNTYCNGIDFDCPKARPAEDETVCGDEGKCRSGMCEPYCTTIGKLPCFCVETEFQCQRCCASPNTTGYELQKTCQPQYNKTEDPLWLQENAPCALGYCKGHKCQKHTQDEIRRVWDIFQYIAPDKIGEFLADNIVGAVLVFSLLFWIPCSCLINFVDTKRLKERQKEERYYSERSSFMRPIGSVRNPTIPRTRVQRHTAKYGSSGNVINSGLNAREQWRASQERGLAMRNHQFRENGQGKLDVVPGSPNDENGMSLSQPSLINTNANANKRPVLLSRSHSRSHPTLVSPTSPASDKSFDGEIKPIAVSSNTNLPALLHLESPFSSSSTSKSFRHSLKRQQAVTSP